MSNDFSYLRHWLSMGVYDRGKRIFTVNGCGFDRIGTALGIFLETQFQPEMVSEMMKGPLGYGCHFRTPSKGKSLADEPASVSLDGACGISSMTVIAEAIGLKVQTHETRTSTLLIIEKGN